MPEQMFAAALRAWTAGDEPSDGEPSGGEPACRVLPAA
jgi:hypothetical protein